LGDRSFFGELRGDRTEFWAPVTAWGLRNWGMECSWYGSAYPYPVPVWKHFLDILIRLHTHYLARYPTDKSDSDRLW